VNPARSAPIGVFDSGIGGLTVVSEIIRQLPSESVVYFGDTARVPYGPKGPDTVRRYSEEIGDFLRDQGVKAIVVACNTATAHALPALRERFDLPVVGVIEPGARAAVNASRGGKIGVIGTQGTIRSGAYERAILSLRADVSINSVACPLFVPLVEEGWTDTEATGIIAREYLDPLSGGTIDTLVLGCTHYPLLKGVIGRTVGRPVRLIDSAEETAAETRRVLRDRGLAVEDGAEAKYRFIASDAPEQFLRLGSRFRGAPIDRVEMGTLGCSIPPSELGPLGSDPEIGEVIQPGASVGENAAGGGALERRDVRVSIHYQLELRLLGQNIQCNRAKASTFIARAIGSTSRGAASREPGCPIWWKQAEGFHRERAPHDRSNHAVSAILHFAQAIAVLDERSPAGKVTAPRPNVIGSTNVLA
jgi:glutamate racemase